MRNKYQAFVHRTRTLTGVTAEEARYVYHQLKDAGLTPSGRTVTKYGEVIVDLLDAIGAFTPEPEPTGFPPRPEPKEPRPPDVVEPEDFEEFDFMPGDEAEVTLTHYTDYVPGVLDDGGEDSEAGDAPAPKQRRKRKAPALPSYTRRIAGET